MLLLSQDTSLPNIYEYTFTGNNPRPPGQGYGIEIETHLNNAYKQWKNQFYQLELPCWVYTPSFPPTAITSLHVHNFTFTTKSRMANFTLLWDAPQFSNGDLTDYEIYIGTEELPPSSDGKDLGGTQLLRISVNVSVHIKWSNIIVFFIIDYFIGAQHYNSLHSQVN